MIRQGPRRLGAPGSNPFGKLRRPFGKLRPGPFRRRFAAKGRALACDGGARGDPFDAPGCST